MAGYSATPLPKKLGLKPGLRAHLHDAPEGYRESLGVEATWTDHDLDWVQVFCPDQAALQAAWDEWAPRLRKDGALWVSWPKRASGVATDLDENVVRDFGLGRGLVDVKVCAVDDVWSGLKFVYRTRDRDGLPQSS